MNNNLKMSFTKVGFWIYNIIYAFLMIRTFPIDRGLGHGLGDLFYIIMFTLYFVAQLLINLFVKNKVILRVVAILNILFAIWILLEIYVYYGPEVSYEWKNGFWKW